MFRHLIDYCFVSSCACSLVFHSSEENLLIPHLRIPSEIRVDISCEYQLRFAIAISDTVYHHTWLVM